MAGPGADFFEAVEREFRTLPFLAEDLGMITFDVTALRDCYELPSTRVLQFGFDGVTYRIVLMIGTACQLLHVID